MAKELPGLNIEVQELYPHSLHNITARGYHAGETEKPLIYYLYDADKLDEWFFNVS